MGHAIHFLERLVRLNDQHTEQALALYNNSEMVRGILDEINPPQSYDRMAISLASGNNGPYIVVSRNGRFITCLGKGMSPGKCFVIRRSQFELYRKRLEMFADRSSYLSDVLNELSECDSPELMITKNGGRMSREAFLAMSAFHPTMKQRYIVCVTTITELLSDVQTRVRRAGTLWDDNGLSAMYWNLFFALGHLSVLASAFGPKGLEKMVDWNESGEYPLYSAFHTGQMMNGARALFAAARMGRFALQVCESGVQRYHSQSLWRFSVWGAAVIGVRHRRLASRVKKALKPSTEIPENPAGQARAIYLDSLNAARMTVENPDDAYAAGAIAARERYFIDSRQNKFTAPYLFECADDVPNDLAFSYVVNTLGDYRFDLGTAALLSGCLVWLARAEAEDLYLPADLLDMIHCDWHPGMTEYLMACDKKWRRLQGGNRLIRRYPGRNSPCICGSDRKFKKCCMSKVSVGLTSGVFDRALENPTLENRMLENRMLENRTMENPIMSTLA